MLLKIWTTRVLGRFRNRILVHEIALRVLNCCTRAESRCACETTARADPCAFAKALRAQNCCSRAESLRVRNPCSLVEAPRARKIPSRAKLQCMRAPACAESLRAHESPPRAWNCSARAESLCAWSPCMRAPIGVRMCLALRGAWSFALRVFAPSAHAGACFRCLLPMASEEVFRPLAGNNVSYVF